PRTLPLALCRLRLHREYPVSEEPTDLEFKDEGQAIGLVQILRSLPKKEFASLVRRIDVAVDPAKRIDVPAQVARALLLSAELRDPGRLGDSAAELLFRIAEAGGRLRVDAAPPGLDLLLARGLVFHCQFPG